eukprot:TRINITY_DN4656_c0_g1_i1.p1 TRINITY_DN4656_c0_g1~~TRINITY_DN4656_c0_g1_i1.p1  ORF type:complete len:158 (+),score=32.75 TRINITY_DN4656_c0_g1_i1:56-475(+)
MSGFPENFGILAAGAQGMFALLLGIRMTQLRVSQMKAKAKTESPAFKKWHTAQLVQAEYNPLFIALFVGIHFAAKAANSPLRFNSEIAIALGFVSSVMFVLGVVTMGDGPVTSPPLLRACGAVLRYVALGMCSYEITQY